MTWNFGGLEREISLVSSFKRNNNGKKITERITDEISEIWKKIIKPEALIDTKADDFFDFEFALLADKFNEE